MNYRVIFDVVIVGLGMYLFFTGYHMKKNGEISTILINSTELTKCKNKMAFIDSIYRQTSIFGGVVLLFGILRLVNDFIVPMGRIFDIGSVIVFLAAWMWYLRELRNKKQENFYM